MVCLLCDFKIGLTVFNQILLTVFNQSYNCQTSRLPKPFLILPSLLWLNQAYNFTRVAGLIMLLPVAEAKADLFDVERSNDGFFL